jgi:hypothetical protein
MLSSSTNFFVYVKTASGNLKVNTLLSLYIADSPEKRDILAMTLGNGVYAQRLGYSSNLRACRRIFSACSRCLLSLESGHVTQDCGLCACWNTLSPHVRFPSPTNFPVNRLFGTNNDLPGIKLSLKSMVTSQKEAVKDYVSGEYTVKNVKAYLPYAGLYGDQVTAVLEYANIVKECALTDSPLPRNVVVPWKALTQISTLQIEDFVDAPAHLIFLGITRAVFHIVARWLSSREKLAPFCRHVQGDLEEINSLNLGWVMALPYRSGGLGGYVLGENMLALSRLVKWFYQDM